MSQKLSKIFSQYVGKEIPTEDFVMASWKNSKTGQQEKLVCQQPVNPNDPVLTAMEKTAHDNGLSLRVWFPEAAGTMDYDPKRVNAYAEKVADGKCRITKRFEIG